jgi:imidazolonepropionase
MVPWSIPGLIDCHTHLAFGGWRAEEFEQRIQGSSYLDIARRGGGIMSTVAQTRTMSEDALLDRARGFLERMMALGVTTVECKSGYGLDVGDRTPAAPGLSPVGPGRSRPYHPDLPRRPCRAPGIPR